MPSFEDFLKNNKPTDPNSESMPADQGDALALEAQNSPVRPEFTNLLAAAKAQSGNGGQSFLGASNPEQTAQSQMDAIDSFKANPAGVSPFTASGMPALMAKAGEVPPTAPPTGDVSPAGGNLFDQVSKRIAQQQADGNVGADPAASAPSDVSRAPSGSPSAPADKSPAAPTSPLAPTSPPIDLNAMGAYGAGADTQAMQAAIGARNNNQLLAQMGQAGQTFNDALNRTKTDMSPYKDAIKNAGQGVTDVEEARKSADQQLVRRKNIMDLASEQEKMDPNSTVSRMMQGVATDMSRQIPSLKGMDFSKMPAMSIEKAMPSALSYVTHLDADAARREIAEQNRLTRQATLKTQMDEREYKHLQTAQSGLDKKKEYAAAKTGLDAAYKADNILDAALTDRSAANQIPTVLGYMSTNGQRINQQEIKQNTGGLDLKSYGERIANKVATGTLTDRDYQDFKKLVAVYKNGAQDEMTAHELTATQQLNQLNGGNTADNYLKLTGRAVPDNAADLLHKLHSTSQTGPAKSSASPQGTPPSNPNNVRIMDPSGVIHEGPKANANTFLKRYPGSKLVQ
jgi:hypothetical protein